MAENDSSDAGIAIAKVIGIMFVSMIVLMALATIFAALVSAGAVVGSLAGLWNYVRALGETVAIEVAEA